MVSEWLEREEKEGLEYEVDDTSNEEVESGSDYEGEGEDGDEEEEEEEKKLKRPRIEKITTSDSEEDDDDDEDDDNNSNTENNGITIEEFNMKQENRRGRFDENGMYVTYGGYDNEDDEELIGIVEVADEEMEKARIAEEKRIQLLKGQEKTNNETKVNEDQSEEAIKILLKNVREGETVNEALQRLNWKRKQLNKPKNKVKNPETTAMIKSIDYEISEIIANISLLEHAYINNIFIKNNYSEEIDIMGLTSQKIREMFSNKLRRST